MRLRNNKDTLLRQFVYCNLTVVTVAGLSFLVADVIGYRSVALLLLATVSVLSIFFSVYPIVMAATMSALIWDFFFIPPHFTFHVENPEDVLLLLMYFLIALVNGFLTSKIREFEKEEYLKEERQNAIKLYKTLFDSLSHELRTPIATIVGATDNLLAPNSSISDENKQHLTDEISIAAFRLNRLIDNLLNMQRVESGMLRTSPDWCEIEELINSAVNRLKDELSTHVLTIRVQDNFPIIKLDFGLIEQALFNILHNNTQYTSPGSAISIDAAWTNGVIELVIADNGDGFTDEELKMLFTKFYRGTTHTTGGTGLGLSIVKGFVEAHGGTIYAENNQPKGARFVISIPTEAIDVKNMPEF